MNMNTNILTVIRKYEYEYEDLSHTKPKINRIVYESCKSQKNNAYMCHSMQFMVFG